MNESVVPLPSSFGRRFWPLFALGLLGIAALPPTIAPLLEAKLQGTGVLARFPLSVLVAGSLIQPTLLLAAGVALGATFAGRLGLCSHVASVNVRRAFSTEVPLAIVSGLVVGLVLIGADHWFFADVRDQLEAARPHTGPFASLAAGLFYGGLTEELVMRWGVMAFAAWGLQRVFRRGAGVPLPSVFWIAIVIAAAVFAVAHLPYGAAIVPLTTALVVGILLLNGAAGLVFGWLFWRRSLEAGMVAHAMTHVVFAVVALA